jgi:hypothetical protein
MRLIGICIVVLFATQLFGQAATSVVQPINLPEELRSANNQFSGLYKKGNKLWLMSESRVQEKLESVVYAIRLKQLKACIEDSTLTPQFEKIEIVGLEKLVEIMKAQNEVFEGLEAISVKGKNVYLSVETETPSTYAYILKGRYKKGKIWLNENGFLPVVKPVAANGAAIYNAAFESIAVVKKRLHIFFEYNYFEGNNYVYSYNLKLDPASKDSAIINPMPFRMSDVYYEGKGQYVGINTFYKGGGKDTINRPRANDSVANTIVLGKSGYRNYSRLVSLVDNGKSFKWETFCELPAKWADGFNWEGVAPFNGGYLIVNDKFTPARPYYSALVFVRPDKAVDVR